MANERLPYILDFQNGSVVNAILKKAEQLPDKAQLDQQLAQKATMSDVQRETQNLQNQINEIVRAPESGGDVAAEVYQARVGTSGSEFQTLKDRLDSENGKLSSMSDTLLEQITSSTNSYFAIDISDSITAGYYISAKTGQEVANSAVAYAIVPCSVGDKFLVDFAGYGRATPLFSAGDDNKYTEVFIDSDESSAEPIEIVVTSGTRIVLNFAKTHPPIVKKYKLGEAIDTLYTRTDDIEVIESEIEALNDELDSARKFTEIDISENITNDYYISADTGRRVYNNAVAFAKISCNFGEKYTVDFAGHGLGTPLFSAGDDDIYTEVFIPYGDIGNEPVEVTIESGTSLIMNFSKAYPPIVKKYQLALKPEKDYSVSGFNAEFTDYAIQAMRPINLSSNAYISNIQPFSLLHFSDIHGDKTELERLKEFYDEFSAYFDDAICTGDLVALRFTNDFSYWDWDEVLLVMGNHDVLADTQGWDWSIRATQQEQYEKYFGNIADWGCTYEEGKTYYYKDYT